MGSPLGQGTREQETESGVASTCPLQDGGVEVADFFSAQLGAVSASPGKQGGNLGWESRSWGSPLKCADPGHELGCSMVTCLPSNSKQLISHHSCPRNEGYRGKGGLCP